MSEVIVRMEMPKNCAECKLQKPMGVCPITDCYALVDAWRDHRPGWCPIIGELPEQHGRIIDEAVFCENVVKYSHQSTKTIGKALDATPTIIDMTPIVAEGSET